ncbi:hypothetical protein CRUP_029926 [Coryphaenoides rupestris]|nr:hypothetical protein CRUP_029926 [Coryphaenoides rupestris]
MEEDEEEKEEDEEDEEEEGDTYIILRPHPHRHTCHDGAIASSAQFSPTLVTHAWRVPGTQMAVVVLVSAPPPLSSPNRGTEPPTLTPPPAWSSSSDSESGDASLMRRQCLVDCSGWGSAPLGPRRFRWKQPRLREASTSSMGELTGTGLLYERSVANKGAQRGPRAARGLPPRRALLTGGRRRRRRRWGRRRRCQGGDDGGGEQVAGGAGEVPGAAGDFRWREGPLGGGGRRGGVGLGGEGGAGGSGVRLDAGAETPGVPLVAFPPPTSLPPPGRAQPGGLEDHLTWERLVPMRPLLASSCRALVCRRRSSSRSAASTSPPMASGHSKLGGEQQLLTLQDLRLDVVEPQLQPVVLRLHVVQPRQRVLAATQTLHLIGGDLPGSLQLQCLLGDRVADSLHALHGGGPGSLTELTLVGALGAMRPLLASSCRALVCSRRSSSRSAASTSPPMASGHSKGCVEEEDEEEEDEEEEEEEEAGRMQCVQQIPVRLVLRLVDGQQLHHALHAAGMAQVDVQPVAQLVHLHLGHLGRAEQEGPHPRGGVEVLLLREERETGLQVGVHGAQLQVDGVQVLGGEQAGPAAVFFVHAVQLFKVMANLPSTSFQATMNTNLCFSFSSKAWGRTATQSDSRWSSIVKEFSITITITISITITIL